MTFNIIKATSFELKSHGAAQTKYPDLMSIYEVLPELHNDFHVYKQVNGSGLTYVNSARQWAVGEDKNGSPMLLSIQTPLLKSPPFHQWQYWDGQQWQETALTLLPLNPGYFKHF